MFLSGFTMLQSGRNDWLIHHYYIIHPWLKTHIYSWNWKEIKKKSLLLEQFKVHRKTEQKVQRFTRTLCAPPPIINSPANGPCVTISPNVCGLLGFPLGAVHLAGLDRCVMMCIHHHGVVPSIFKTLKVPPSPSTPATTVFLVLLFPEPRIVEIMQNVIF